MILISKDEREKILCRYPDVHVRRTMKGRSDRHKYYVEESEKVVRLLKEMRQR